MRFVDVRTTTPVRLRRCLSSQSTQNGERKERAPDRRDNTTLGKKKTRERTSPRNWRVSRAVSRRACPDGIAVALAYTPREHLSDRPSSRALTASPKRRRCFPARPRFVDRISRNPISRGLSPQCRSARASRSGTTTRLTTRRLASRSERTETPPGARVFLSLKSARSFSSVLWRYFSDN